MRNSCNHSFAGCTLGPLPLQTPLEIVQQLEAAADAAMAVHVVLRRYIKRSQLLDALRPLLSASLTEQKCAGAGWLGGPGGIRWVGEEPNSIGLHQCRHFRTVHAPFLGIATRMAVGGRGKLILGRHYKPVRNTENMPHVCYWLQECDGGSFR